MTLKIIFFKSVYISSVAFFISSIFFPNMQVLGATALCGIGLRPLVDRMLEMNRQSIWDEKISPWKANDKLALQILTLFFTIFSISGGLEFVFGKTQALTNITPFQFSYTELFLHNLSVLTAGIVLSVLFSSGGLILILSWNALHWSTSFLHYLSQFHQESNSLWTLVSASTWIPHLLFEIVAYVLAGLSGVFFSKAIVKYPIYSNELRRVSVACLLLLFIGVLVLALAAELELRLAGAARLLN